MTNTANTPVEAMERSLPVRVRRFELRDGSGGDGGHRGGDGVVKELEALEPMDVSLIGDRRRHGPPGTNGAAAGEAGADQVLREDGVREDVPGQVRTRLLPGERFHIETPGGGGRNAPARNGDGNEAQDSET